MFLLHIKNHPETDNTNGVAQKRGKIDILSIFNTFALPAYYYGMAFGNGSLPSS